MNDRDLAHIRDLSSRVPELARLHTEHEKLSRSLDSLSAARLLTPAEREEMKTLKREKLRRKDRIQAILARHGAAEHQPQS